MNFSPQTIKTWLNKPTTPYVVSSFRIAFGVFMTYEIIDYFRIGLVKNMFVLPAINFRYDYLKWMKPLPEIWLNLILGAVLVFALCITLGLFFKWACRFFAAGYLYIFLLDKSIYNNHIYLFILLAFLLSFTDADKSLSVVSRKFRSIRIPYWQQFILQLQIVIVYFYGGLAKLKYDWLVNCEPMQTLISMIPEEHFLAFILKNDFGLYLFNYGGLLIDLGVPLWLWNSRVRKWAILPIILFHIINSFIFHDIGIFPFVMLVSLMLFYHPDEIPFLRQFGKEENFSKKSKRQSQQPVVSRGATSRSTIYALILYFAFQLIFPLRGYFLPNNMDWTTIGNRFAWRMKVDTRQLKEMNFTMMNEQNQTAAVEIQKLVNDMQILNLSMDPRSAVDFARMVQQRTSEMNMKNIQVKATIKVSYNGRPAQNFINSELDLTTASYSPFKQIEWVYPVQ